MEDKFKKAGNKMQAIGCLLTIVLTIPIILTFIFGPTGLVIGLVIGLIAFLVMKKK